MLYASVRIVILTIWDDKKGARMKLLYTLLALITLVTLSGCEDWEWGDTDEPAFPLWGPPSETVPDPTSLDNRVNGGTILGVWLMDGDLSTEGRLADRVGGFYQDAHYVMMDFETPFFGTVFFAVEDDTGYFAVAFIHSGCLESPGSPIPDNRECAIADGFFYDHHHAAPAGSPGFPGVYSGICKMEVEPEFEPIGYRIDCAMEHGGPAEAFYGWVFPDGEGRTILVWEFDDEAYSFPPDAPAASGTRHLNDQPWSQEGGYLTALGTDGADGGALGATACALGVRLQDPLYRLNGQVDGHDMQGNDGETAGFDVCP